MDKKSMESRETHDFMNVHSFSQLPFIRPPPSPPPLKDKDKDKDKPLKLFGIEFPNDDSKDSADNGETSRRFECHYCCRNFPTSQALGGHQNAHKRERQHAKRAHLHSAMLHNTLSADAYGLMNYRLASSSYPTWHHSSPSAAAAAGGRFYGSHGAPTTSYPHHHLQPINGSPLALWQIPSTLQNNPTTTSSAFNRDRSLHLQHHPLPLLAGDDITVGASHHHQVVGSAASQNGLVYDSNQPGVHDHVSLDLHL